MVSAFAQTMSCDVDVSKPLCLGTVVTCTSVVTGTVSQTRWILKTSCPSGHNYIAFPQIYPCSSSGTCGPYITATNFATGATTCQTSRLKVTMATNISGLVVECRDFTTGVPGTLVGNASFTLQGEQCLHCWLKKKKLISYHNWIFDCTRCRVCFELV